MPRQLTFLHAADLHLGAPFRGLRAISPAWADRLLRAIPEAYDRVIDIAIKRKVDFVVIAGDIFDDARASYADYLHFFRGLERLDEAGIPSYMCTGNHDPFATWQQDFLSLPPSATMFSADAPDFALYERNGEPLCVLGGRGYPNSVWAGDQSIAAGITRAAANEALGPRAAAAPFGVGVLHTGLDLDNIKAPASRRELLAAGFDYWALGHIHRRYVDDESNPRMIFPGDIQGRDIKETGRRGVTMVTLTQGEPNKAEFVPTSSVAWEQITLDVSDCVSVPEINKKLMSAQFTANGPTQCEEMVTRITLTGATPLHDLLAHPSVIEDMRAAANESYAEFFVDAIINKTTRPIDRAALRAEGLFPAVFLNAADALRDDRESEVAYLQQEFFNRNVPLPSDPLPDPVQLAREAEDLVLDLLIQGDAQ